MDMSLFAEPGLAIAFTAALVLTVWQVVRRLLIVNSAEEALSISNKHRNEKKALREVLEYIRFKAGNSDTEARVEVPYDLRGRIADQLRERGFRVYYNPYEGATNGKIWIGIEWSQKNEG